ncbi:MAG: hypothetical protein KGD60_06060 [Candidatus Thorarchaeota archaeon]|nr:hypothetical protein [Candidatus Thorarchaeota archaeon]
MMKNLCGRSTTRLLAYVTLLFILTPSISGAVFLGNEINGSPFIPAQNETIWEILNHDYLSDNIDPSDVEFVNATHGWVLSQSELGTRQGMILHTNDSGDSWHQQLYNTSQSFTQIAVIDSETLWVTAIGGLYYTETGGRIWNVTNIGDPNDFFYGIQFINRTHGWTSSHTSMYKTTDGGQNWESVESWTFDDDWGRGIHFITPLEGWVIGFLGIYHTENGGATWVKEVTHGGGGMSFVSETEAWVISDDWLAHMTDGETWVEKPLPRTSLLPSKLPYFSDILFLDTNNGWIVGDESEVAYTPNGGINWYSQSFPHDNRVLAVDFINVTHGWATGWGGYIYRTTKGNSLGTPLWSGLTDSLVLWVVSAVVVVAISSTLVVRRRKQKITKTHQGVDLR